MRRGGDPGDYSLEHEVQHMIGGMEGESGQQNSVQQQQQYGSVNQHNLTTYKVTQQEGRRLSLQRYNNSITNQQKPTLSLLLETTIQANVLRSKLNIEIGILTSPRPSSSPKSKKRNLALGL